MRDDEHGTADTTTADTATDALMTRMRAQVGPGTFRDGFADRVMWRLQRPHSAADAMQRTFVRLAPMAVAATVLLAAMNLLSTRASDQSIVERVFGVPPVREMSEPIDSDLGAWGVAP